MHNGLNPFWYGATLGSTATGACDYLVELAPLCQKYNMYLSVDSAYLGTSFHKSECRVNGI